MPRPLTVLRREVAMRACVTLVVLCVVVLVPREGNAQANIQPAPVPLVTAASADWQIRGEPVFSAGSFYYPTGPNVFFDGNVMIRTGVYRGVPLYVDASIDPIGLVYVPIGRNVMRPYERLRSGDLAGTVGNRAPSLPIAHDVETSVAAARAEIATPPVAVDAEPAELADGDPARHAIGTSGSFIVPRPATSGEPPAIEGARPRHTIVESIPAPRMNRGIWLEFDGKRWYSAGAAVPYSADRFRPVGDYRGFPVYREKAKKSDEIFVAAVKDGPLTPYKR
jgi:hypothetical protein